MQEKRWARVKRSGAHGLRRGAWYLVVNNAKSDLVILDVRKENVPIPRSMVEITTTAPTRWSVVQWEESQRGAQRASESRFGLVYAVCPGCRARQQLRPPDAERMTCEECGEAFDVEWEQVC